MSRARFVSVASYTIENWRNRGGNKSVGDKEENKVYFEENRRHYELLTGTLLSCWTELPKDSITSSDWDIFQDRRDGVALLSTVEAVSGTLSQSMRYLLDKNGWYLEQDSVQYYDGITHPPQIDTMRLMFWKRDIYKIQREYRFALLCAFHEPDIETLIFYVNDPGTYIHKIYLGPKTSSEDKRRLAVGAIRAHLADRIQDFDEIYKKNS